MQYIDIQKQIINIWKIMIKTKESSYIQYLDGNSLYGWAMSQKLSVDDFKWKRTMLKFIRDFVKNYDEDNDKGSVIEVDVKYPKRLHSLDWDLPFLQERMKINKFKKLVCNMYDKNNYVLHITSLKQALVYRIILKKAHKVTQFNQEAWLK